MNRISKHGENQQTISRVDFSGGLNTSANVDGISENQLSVAVNVEVDHATGRLKTVAGTIDILLFNSKIYAALYDGINQKLLLVTEDKKVYATDFETVMELGDLNGSLYPIATSWECGLLIASGSKLQYYNGTTLDTITGSPNASSVYVRAGRVLVTDSNNVRYSATGDEKDWVEDTNYDASAKFVEAGYKDGGNLIGMINLSQDVLLIKDNKRLYRLSGEYPNWQISEVSRNIEVNGRLSYCSIADAVFMLGKSEVQSIQTTDTYGDMKPQNIAILVTNEIQKLSIETKLRYVPPLNQIWAINGRYIMVFDLVTQSWYKREFNSTVIDVICIGTDVLIIKEDRVSKLDESTFYDEGKPLRWQWQAQRLVSQHEYLLKRTQVSVTPLSTILYTGQVRVGAVIIGLPIPTRILSIYYNRSRIYKNRTKICSVGRRRFVYAKGEMIYDNLTPICWNKQKVFSHPTVIKESRNVFRSRFIDIGGSGSMGGIIFNSITLTISEV